MSDHVETKWVITIGRNTQEQPGEFRTVRSFYETSPVGLVADDPSGVQAVRD